MIVKITIKTKHQIINHSPNLWGRHHYTSNHTQHQLTYPNLHLAKPPIIRHTKYQMGSAYRPRHKTKQIRYSHYHIFKQTFNTITRPIHKQTKLTHYLPKHSKKIILALPNLFTTSKYTLIKYYKINKRNPNVK